ncbi:DUF1566 domain-containing protein [bacterium]|nr:DUF1566 domain-containing protein [bacterium]
MNDHNFGFAAEWEILDGNGKIVRRSRPDKRMIAPEGKIELTAYDEKGRVIGKRSQPMKSLTVGMIEDFVNGYRIAVRNDSYAASAPKVMLGMKAAPVYVQQPGLIHPFINYPTNALVSGSVSSDTIPITLLAMSDVAGSTRVTLYTARTITGGNGNIGEIALYSCSGKMLGREAVTPAFGFGVGKVVEVAWTLNFPATESKAITKNWIKNFAQNIAAAAYTFTDMAGNTAAGSMSHTGQSFAKAANCVGAAGVTDMGIIVGSGDSAVSADDNALAQLIASGTSTGELSYLAMSSVSAIAKLSVLEGKTYATYVRDFTNNSTAAITVREAGLVAKTAVTTEGVEAAGSYMLARWLTGDITVNPGETLRIYFKPTVIATAESHTGLSTDIVVVTDAMRETYPELAEISMVQKAGVSGKTWPQALEYAWNLNLGGYTDWRLPRCAGNKADSSVNNELCGLWRARNNLGLATDNNNYWSGSEKDASNAWGVNFDSSGSVNNNGKSYARYVRCVR